jgi:hypothetical protein
MKELGLSLLLLMLLLLRRCRRGCLCGISLHLTLLQPKC